MANRIGVCPNRGSCTNAYSRIRINVPEGAEFKCPVCRTQLVEDGGGGGSPVPRVIISLIAVLFAALLGLLAYRYWPSRPNGNDNGNENIADAPRAPTPSPTPNAADTCKGQPMHRNVWTDIKTRGYIIMGVQSSALPMNYSEESEEWGSNKDKTGEGDEEARRRKELYWTRTGFDYELANMLAADMGWLKTEGRRLVRAREVPEFKDLFCLLNRQEKDGNFSVDMIMSGIARDPTYDDTISWTKPYAKVGYSLVTKKSSDIMSLDDCKGKKIGVVNGDNIVKKYLNSHLEHPQMVELSDEEDEWLSNALNLDGGVDAVVYDYPFAVEELKGINEAATEEGLPGKLLEIRVAKLPDANLDYAIGVPKGEAIDKVTDERNPRYVALVQKYFRSEYIVPVHPLPGERVYVVKGGDSLSKIAAAELGDMGRWVEIARLNTSTIANVHLIFKGQTLRLPGPGQPTPPPPGS
jgi:ABC-type amino acid transport substrate-binding protein